MRILRLMPLVVVLGAAAAGCAADSSVFGGAACTDGFVAACTCSDGIEGEAVCADGVLGACDCDGADIGFDVVDDIGGIDTFDTTEASDADAGEDAGCAVTHPFWPDIDGDGYGDARGTFVTVCEQPPGFADNPGDCNDEDALSYPGGIELCDGVDNDCDALADEEIIDVPQWTDADNDGYGDPDSTITYGCDRVPGRAPNDDDCDDSNDAVRPRAEDVCDALDNDCDTRVDEDAATSTWWLDADEDGYGDSEGLPNAACAPLEGFVENRDDCDDESALINPDGEEVCDLVDNDCDDIIDEDSGLLLLFADTDNDGYGDAFARPRYACEPIDGLVTTRGDCDDADASVNPDADEVCDEIDNDCDGRVDDLAGEGYIFYADADADGYGDARNIWVGCIAPPRFVPAPGDCDDRRGEVNPDAPEACDSLDNNCNGFVDEGLLNACGRCGDVPAEVCGDVLDNDCDGQIDEAAAGCFCDGRTNQPCYAGPAGTLGIGVCRGGTADCACPGGAETCANGQYGACEGQVLPGAEVCDGLDNDCDGQTDEGVRNACGQCAPEPTEVCDGLDNDCDGLTDEGLRLACGVCPGDEVEEACGDALDNDCDGFVDEGCPCAGEFEACYPGDPATLGVGACAAGSRFCYAGAEGPTECVGAVLPTVETCNGVDDDCDGRVDVAPDGCSICGLSDEVCDGADNDCDGQTDEGLRNGCGVCLAGIAPEERGGATLCDGLDNDCDGLIDEGLLNACGVCDGPCYTLRWDDAGDFGGGEFDAVAVTPGGLVLNTTTSTYSDLWIANSGADSVTRINTVTGAVVGTYPVGLNGGSNDDSPSRTAVDFDGNAWVASRAFDRQGSVSKIRGQDCVTNCTLFTVPVGGINGLPRALAIDRDGFVWVGNFNEARAYKLNPDNGAVIASYNLGINPYGFAIDRTGILWIATISGQGIGAFDIASGTMIGNWTIPGCSQPYGIAIDGAGNVWTGNWQCGDNDLVRLDRAAFNESPRRIVIESFANANLLGTRGVAVDGSGDVWVVASNTNRIGRFDPDSRSWVGTYPVCDHPTGVGIANDGNIWAACYNSSNSNRLRPDGSIIATTNTGLNPYSYSDLTGFQLRNFTARQGYFRKVFDCGFANCSFDRATWESSLPVGTTVAMRFRTSSDGVGWSAWSIEYSSSPADLSVPLGRFIQAEVRMTTAADEVSPAFRALEIAWQRP